MPSTGSISSCDEPDRHGERNRPSANGPSTRFACVRRSAWSELPIASQPAIPPRPTPRCSARRTRKDASTQSSAADLLSCASARTLYSQARGLSPLPTPTSRSRFTGGWKPAGPRKRESRHWMAIAGSSSPGRPSSWCCTDRPESNHPPEGMPSVLGQSPHGCCRSVASRVNRLSGAPRRRPMASQHPSIALGGQDLCFRRPPRQRSGRSKTPSTNESHRPRSGFRPHSTG